MRKFPYLFERPVYGCNIKVRQVNADLRQVLLLKVPANSLTVLQTTFLTIASTLSSQVQCNPVGQTDSRLLVFTYCKSLT